MKPWPIVDQSQLLQEDFFQGLKYFHSQDWLTALSYFRSIYHLVSKDDTFRCRYMSYYGLVQIYLGNIEGIQLCRRAACGEMMDAGVFCNLVMAELELDHRHNAYKALCQGLDIDQRHPGLNRMQLKMGMRRSVVVPFLKRRHWINRLLGRLMYRLFNNRF
ncbi:MAG: hypothetical protein GXP22_00955 [Gammaproteobacteria bacterium]|nr:hypothetical protein [Gammaproteobacteria bacterium]